MENEEVWIISLFKDVPAIWKFLQLTITFFSPLNCWCHHQHVYGTPRFMKCFATIYRMLLHDLPSLKEWRKKPKPYEHPHEIKSEIPIFVISHYSLGGWNTGTWSKGEMDTSAKHGGRICGISDWFYFEEENPSQKSVKHSIINEIFTVIKYHEPQTIRDCVNMWH